MDLDLDLSWVKSYTYKSKVKFRPDLLYTIFQRHNTQFCFENDWWSGSGSILIPNCS